MLFSSADISSEKASSGSAFGALAGNTVADAPRMAEFKALLGDIKPGMNIHFKTVGNWSLHELIGYLLTITGPAAIYFSTWSIREEPVRSLINWKSTGAATGVYCLLDHRAAQRDHQTVMLCEGNFDKVSFAKCHAKVTLLINDDWKISINGSQNYTRNPRIECGVISTDPEVCDFHFKWLQDELAHSTQGH